jgi:hypothetical protein
MLYRVEVAGKIFQGEDPRILLKRAVQARKSRKPVLEGAFCRLTAETQRPRVSLRLGGDVFRAP